MLDQFQAEVREAEGGDAAGAAPASGDEPAEYSFLTMPAITDMCNNFEEVIKGQSNREFFSDFKKLLESAVTSSLGHELGDAVKPKNASDEQTMRAHKPPSAPLHWNSKRQ